MDGSRHIWSSRRTTALMKHLTGYADPFREGHTDVCQYTCEDVCQYTCEKAWRTGYLAAVDGRLGCTA